MKKSLLAILKDLATGKGVAPHKRNEGETLDSSINAIPAVTYKDHNGNAVYPTLNPDGTLPTSTNSGKPFVSHEVLIIANQIKDSAVKACSVALEVDGDEILTYTKPDFKITSFMEARARLELIVDEGLGGEAITVLGYGAVADVFINDKNRIVNNFAEVPAGATTAELRLMVTAYEDGNQADDVDCSISINKLPPQTP